MINGNCGENFVEAGNRGFTRLQPEEGCSVSESLPATFLAPSLGSRHVAAVVLAAASEHITEPERGAVMAIASFASPGHGVGNVLSKDEI